jgi:hypothetical protein
MSKKVPYRNKSPYGWWVATEIIRFQFYDEDRSNPRRRCCADENTFLIKARDRHAAYRKAMAHGRTLDGAEGVDIVSGRKGTWVFEGLTSLLPVFDELEDGAEILWMQHPNITVGKVQSRIREKEDLEVFDDEPREWDSDLLAGE